MNPRTRFAPTPSGFLHLGNAVHLATLSSAAELFGWELFLRVDDLDSVRVQAEYIDDIFDMLRWLDIAVTEGPVDAAQLHSTWSQQRRMESYVNARDALMDSDAPVYVCGCSRKLWQTHAGDGCPGGCMDLELTTGVNSLRMRQTHGADVVVWRREGLPAFHLASVVDDHVWGVTHVVRGADLIESTRVQREIAQWLPGNAFTQMVVVHHDLILDRHGHKLSKSSGAGAEPIQRTAEMRQEIERLSQDLLAKVQTNVSEIDSTPKSGR